MDSSVGQLVFGKHSRMLPWVSLLLVFLMTIPPTSPTSSHEEDEPHVPLRDEVTRCPSRCICTREEMVDCGGVDLSLFPSNLSANIQLLSLQNNQLEKIPAEELSKLTKLRTLSLHNNKLLSRGLPDKAFKFLRELEHLYLSNNKNNKITKIPKGAFRNLEQLRELYLQRNRLSNAGITAQTFSKMKGLEYLDLSSNGLVKIPEGLPPNIVILQLGKNRITSISESSINGIRNLEYLLLQNNRITSAGIHRGAFAKVRNLHTLHLFNNPLGKVPDGLPRRVNSLMLLHNGIQEIGPSDFVTTYHLTELNLSYNKLHSERVHRLAFRKLHRLKRIDLSGNHLTQLPSGLPPGLETLIAQHGQINRLSVTSLRNMKALQELRLNHNELTVRKIEPGTWGQVPNLKLLDLGYNKLSYVPPDLPESLEYIYLQNNHISMITSDSFASTLNIKVIVLRSNRLTSAGLERKALMGLQHLQVLDLTGNLEHINVLLHSDLEELTQADSINAVARQRNTSSQLS
ncbi:podocan-like isoform X2 [Mobula hypostoma]|uniref:podocan-like isoform X2 n=1 Tax=Mobula hypostoma TaxID=723540 RepID=UPI002FC33F0E